MVASLPEAIGRKRLGNARYDRIRREIDHASVNKKGVAYNDGYATLVHPQLRSVFGGSPEIMSKGRYQHGNWLKGTTDYKDLRNSYQLDGAHWREVKRSLFPTREVDSHNVVSRKDLIAMHKATNTPVNEGELIHDYYFNLFPSRPATPGSSEAAKAMRGGKKDEQLPSLDYMRRMVGAMKSLPYDNGGTWRAARNNKITRVAANDIRNTPGDAFIYLGEQGIDKLPRSIKTTLSRIDGENVLEPGTRANALYTRLRSSNNPRLRNLASKLTGNNAALADLVEQGGQAGYFPGAGVLMVSPKIKGYAHINAHERAHEAFHKMAPKEHVAVVSDLAQRLRNVGVRNGLNIPWDNPKLMQEALADGYRMLKGGPGGSVDTGRLARWNLNADANAMKRIDNLVGASDVEKEMLRQLYVNYQHDIFNRASRLP